MEPAVLAWGWATGCGLKEKILLCHSEAGNTRAMLLLCEPGSCKRGFAIGERQKPLPLRHPAARAPAAPAWAEPLLPCLHAPTPASGTVLVPGRTPRTPLRGRAPWCGHSAAWPAMSLPCAVGFVWSWPRAGWCGQGRGWGQEPAASPSSCRGRLPVLGWGWGGRS